MALLILAFFTGMLTVFAPCVLPLLPVIIGGSISDSASKSRIRPYVIAISLAVSLFAFTILLKASTALTGVSPKVWTYASGVIVVALGLASLFPHLWEQVMFRTGLLSRSQTMLDSSSRKGWLAPVLTGAALGPVFSSCSPTYAFILAVVLPRNTAKVVAYLTVYCIGLVVALLVISLLGRNRLKNYRWVSDTTGWFRRSLGVLFIIVGVAIFTGYDVKFQVWAANHLPNVGSIDQHLLNKTTKKTAHGKANSGSNSNVLANKDLFNVSPYAAPQFAGLTNWINSNPLTLSQLKGKVVLVDFWTYSCINCIRATPHVEAWYQTYKSRGLVVVGVHAPEFSFEHIPANVRNGVKQLKITYPVALDNNFTTWDAYNNEYWPAEYLIDKHGNVVRQHFGEGEYDKTEDAIKALLNDRSSALTNVPTANLSDSVTPETYFGTGRADRYEGSPNLAVGESSFTPAANLDADSWTLGGDWLVASEQITSVSATSTLQFHVHAKNVYVVTSVANGVTRTITVKQQGVSGNW